MTAIQPSPNKKTYAWNLLTTDSAQPISGLIAGISKNIRMHYSPKDIIDKCNIIKKKILLIRI